MASTDPGAKAIITSATRNDSRLIRIAAKTAEIATATANEPKAAATKFSSIRGEVLAKREPVIAPIATIAVFATHHGITAWISPVPCRIAEVSMAPKSNPPGKRNSIGDDRDDGRCRKEDGQLVEHIEAERTGHSRRRMADKSEQRQASRKANGNHDNADALHDRDRPKVAPELGPERQNLRHAARRGRKVGIDCPPPVHKAQIPCAADGNDRHREN